MNDVEASEPDRAENQTDVVALMIVGAAIAVILAINPERVGWLSWRSTGADAAISLIIVAVLFLIPLATSLKVAGIEIVVPAGPEPTLDRIDPAAIAGFSTTP